LSSYLEQYFGLKNMIDLTYPIRMETYFGWPGMMFWPSAFAWWASDITFPGVIILMFFIGRLYCLCFKEAYLYSNPISMTLMAYLTILLVFLPDNNQIFQTRHSFVTTVVLLFVWLFYHKKFNLTKKIYE